MAGENDLYERDVNLFFPGIEAVNGQLHRLRDWCARRTPVQARQFALVGYYAVKFVLVGLLLTTFLFGFFFFFLVGVPAYGILRLCRVPTRLSFLIGSTASVVCMIIVFAADNSPESLGPLTPLWDALLATLVAIEWGHFFLAPAVPVPDNA